MAAPAFVEKLQEQIGHEFAAHQQYVAIATYYDALTMPQMAALFYAQALEERDHAMMMVQYLLDADEQVVIPALDAPRMDFADVVSPVELALAQEKRVTEQINELTRVAREASDFASDQFMQWFIKEQVEEVATMSDLLAVVTRSKDDLERIEDWVAREDSGPDSDPMAPPVAGA
ncbi:ferritin [Aeromicrobium sp. YIM 150415]|uniref:Ferritin n=1 Tax=Aeromicrobium piscarium TaxID=2590901 RepID=A0A554SGW3_9ACTN|nr:MULTISPECIES: ferritin [Aeromicrobium]MBM9462928.1 ferritin [Aeromicrobium sp. YIM 150415]TSD65573.1 ferritin [Aeromicrobium piscarium]